MPVFVIDEDLPRSMAAALRESGHLALDVRDHGLRGKSDRVIFDFAQRNNASVLTGDMGFGNLRHYPLGAHRGIVILHYPNEVPPAELNRNLLKALTTLAEDDFPGNLIIIEPGRVRIRRAG